MKVLLVNPYIYDFTAYDLWLKPLGLLYIAAVLEKYTDSQLFWLDALDRYQTPAKLNKKGLPHGGKKDGRGKYHREVVNKPEIFEDTPRYYARYGMPWKMFTEQMDALPEIDIILVTSLMTYWIDGVKITIEAIRQRFPKAKIILGGIIPNLVSHGHLKHQIPADEFISGYGESKILDIMAGEGATVYDHPDFNSSQGMNALPYPAVQFLSNREALPLMTARGCPFTCTYCASKILNPNFIQRSSQQIYDEISYMHHTYGTKHFAIFDDALLLNKQKRFLKVFTRVKETLNVNFHTPNGMHTGEIDRETANLLYESGFKTLRLSFESTSEDILARSSDKVTVNQMVQAVENLEKAGYRRQDIGVYLLFGLPGQQISQIETALSFVKGLGVIPHLCYFTPVPGTPDFLNLQKAGILSTPVNLHETNKIYFLYTKSGFSHQEIQHIREQATTITDRARS